ncbi:MAG TPA: hypothetical protein VMP03_09980 [Methylomirabilota bacterium]|nr:hypothetical protein [Methylomirabilota bacterium]
MVAILTRQRTKRPRTGPILRGRTRVLRGGRAREIWRDLIVPGVHFMSEKEGRYLFDVQARKNFGISGEEFLARFDAGEYDAITDMDEIHRFNRMVMMMSFVRRIPA